MKPVVLVVGGGSGIGRACALTFAEHGYDVIVAGRSQENLKGVCRDVQSKGGSCSYVVLDVTSAKSIQDLEKYVKEKKVRVEVLVNSAGINTPKRGLAEMDDKTTQEIVATNLTGSLMVARMIVKHMRENGGGTIIQIGSSAGVKTSVLSGVAYSATKKALFSLVRSVNLEQARYGVRASIIAPATVNTELLLRRPKVPSSEERKRVLQPETIAETAWFIAKQPKNVVIEQVVMTSSGEVEFL